MFLQAVNTGQSKPKLLDEVRINLRANHYSPKSVKTTMIYTHVLKTVLRVKSPLA